MTKILYVNGCSHSAGAEIEYPLSSKTKYDLDNSFGGIIARKYGLEHHNDALYGGSNNLIVSTTVQSVLTLLHSYKPSDIFVLIGWTGFDRSEVIYDDKYYRLFAMTDTSTLPDTVKNYYKAWAMTTDSDIAINNFLLQYGLLASFLKLHKIPYYFFNAVQGAYVPKKNLLHGALDNKPNESLVRMLQSDENFLDPFDDDMSFWNYLRTKFNPTIDGRLNHFAEDAHSAWAELLLRRMPNLGE